MLSYTQDNGVSGTMSEEELSLSCDRFTFDVVLGNDGNGNVGPNTGSHWDCWLPLQEFHTSSGVGKDPKKLGKHLSRSLWKDHLVWLNHPNGHHAQKSIVSGYVDLVH